MPGRVDRHGEAKTRNACCVLLRFVPRRHLASVARDSSVHVCVRLA